MFALMRGRLAFVLCTWWLSGCVDEGRDPNSDARCPAGQPRAYVFKVTGHESMRQVREIDRRVHLPGCSDRTGGWANSLLICCSAGH